MLKLNRLFDDYLEIYLNEEEASKVNFNDKNCLEGFVKKIILDLKKCYNITLNGIYNLTMYISNGYGLFIEIKKKDSLFTKDSIDLRVAITYDCNFYFKTEDYSIVSKCKDIFYYDNNFYVELNELCDLLDLCEFGEVVYLDFINNKENCIKI